MAACASGLLASGSLDKTSARLGAVCMDVLSEPKLPRAPRMSSPCKKKIRYLICAALQSIQLVMCKNSQERHPGYSQCLQASVSDVSEDGHGRGACLIEVLGCVIHNAASCILDMAQEAAKALPSWGSSCHASGSRRLCKHATMTSVMCVLSPWLCWRKQSFCFALAFHRAYTDIGESFGSSCQAKTRYV